MTKLTLKDAHIVSLSGGAEDLFEITLSCRMEDVEGVIQDVFGLDVEIKSQEE